MILINTKNQTIITKNLIALKNLMDKSLGLIIRDIDQAVIFKTRFGIHTFLLKTPIDVIICDKTLKVQAYKKNLKPNRICLWNPIYNLVIELPAGAIKKGEINLGDTLNIHNEGETW